MTIGYGDLRRGLPIELDGEPYTVVEYERTKMQQRAPVMRIRFRSLRTGRIVDRSFAGYDVKLTPASVDRRKAQVHLQPTAGSTTLWTPRPSTSCLSLKSKYGKLCHTWLIRQGSTWSSIKTSLSP